VSSSLDMAEFCEPHFVSGLFPQHLCHIRGVSSAFSDDYYRRFLASAMAL
jgi:hypothetical protein